VSEQSEQDLDQPEREEKRAVVGSATGWSLFDAEKKLLFLEAARRFYPNISRCCQEVGICWQTFSNHRKQDKIFAAQLAEIDREVTDRIEGVMAEEAVNPKSFLDRMAYLRAHRPELYDRAKVVKIEGYKMDGAEKARRLGAVDAAIDAEIVKTYTTRQERRRLPAGGGEGTGQAAQGEGGTDGKSKT